MESSWALSEFELSQIRLIVYQDCERRGRQVMFDSKAVLKLDVVEPCNKGDAKTTEKSRSSTYDISGQMFQKDSTPTYQYTRPASDVNMLGEMMFGSVAMSYKGSMLKIHHIRSPPQLMVSKIFSAQLGASNIGITNTLQDSFDSIGQTCPSYSSSAAYSKSMDVPSRGHSDDGDSGIACSASLTSQLATPLPSPGSSSNSGGSFQRRWLRSQATSLHHGLVPPWSTEEMFCLSDDNYGSNPALVQRKKIAISIIISLSEKPEENKAFQEFFFSHFPLFESHMKKLKTAIERAMILCRRVAESSQRVQVYLCRIMDALGDFRMTVWNLYMAPRISEPVWLTMLSQASERRALCQRFLKEMSLLMEHSGKTQFLSALLTAVLMYHLAWVPTVMPSNHSPIKPACDEFLSCSVDLLAKSHPYNPLWAQLGDLYGALGSPVHVCRTVVVGRRREVVQRALYVLSYFIRCSDLQESDPVPYELFTLNPLNPQGHTDNPDNPSASEVTKAAPCFDWTSNVSCPTSQSFPSSDQLNDVQVSFPELSEPQACSEQIHDLLNPDCAANQSSPLHNPQFLIGNTREQELEDQELRVLGLEKKWPLQQLTDMCQNERSDIAPGENEDDDSFSQQQEVISEQKEYEIPLSSSCSSKMGPQLSVNHFGHSLLGGYCPQYMPDFVLHGITSDQRLRQCLMGDLEHMVLHPSLDEPITEAVCIVADTDRLCVQIATSQRQMGEGGQLGRDILVSSLVNSILTSVLQLHKLNLSAEFCVMHLEDRLQEVYFKSRTLAEYLRGQTRVHVRQLGLALGIESSDLPLLTMVASTHSPYVARILL
ncbi:folliculin-interacting protein 2 [Denticeps clupeoides]|uniref:folliculin-interacting protein 2 n=1 Tax=Denticeps clupeoides TaxID=299321 RepID=UPI0010A52A70|nr:folliculin-interacting protein 2 [Denticeps clupeoides]